MRKIEFFFDFLSPFSYFAWLNHLEIGPLKETALYRPVVMGKLFNHWGIKGPGEVAPKRELMLKNCFRYAAKENLDFLPPKTHPFNPLYALRLATRACAGEDQLRVIDSLWRMIWAQGKSADDPQVLEEFLNAQGLEGAALMERSFSREAKLELKQNTKEALDQGVFGVPSFLLNGELFWGNDSLEYLVNALEGKDHYDEEVFRSRTSENS